MKILSRPKYLLEFNLYFFIFEIYNGKVSRELQFGSIYFIIINYNNNELHHIIYIYINGVEKIDGVDRIFISFL